MQAAADAAGLALRPHVKGHKCAWIAARQLRAGAVGLAAATLEEAEGLLRAGLGEDVLLTSDLPPQAAPEVVALNRLGDLAVVADDPRFVAALSAAWAAAPLVGGRRLRVFVDLDVGQGRGGARTPEEAESLAAAIVAADGLIFAGVQAYEGHLQLAADDARRAGHAQVLARMWASVERLTPPVVTSAGTGTASLAAHPVTEIQPGSYALMDASYRAAGAPFEQAAHVVTTVRSVVDGGVIVDAGLKAVSIDMGPAVVDGGGTWTPAGDEHGFVEGRDLQPGDRVRLVPSHTDTTVRLHRELWVDGTVPLPVSAG